MRRSYSGLAAVFLFLLLSMRPGLAADGGSIAISAAPPPYPADARPIFPTDTRDITATVTLPGKEKARVEFVWTGPDGRPYAEIVKILYPAGGSGPPTGRDTLKVAGEAPSRTPGWWGVEAVYGDRKLSARFLLTNNRQLLAIAHGDKGGKLAALAGIDLKAEGAEDALRIALEDKDVKVRVAAVKALGGRGGGWEAGVLEKAMDDPAAAVRSGALRALLAAGGEGAARAAEKGLADGSREVRKTLVEGLSSSGAAWAVPVLGRLLKDEDDEVRSGALGALSMREGPEAVHALSEGRNARDGGFRREVFNVLAARKATGGPDWPVPWLKDKDPELRILAISEVAAASGPEASPAIRPLVADPSAPVAEAALDALYGLGDTGGVVFAAGEGGVAVRKKAVAFLVKMKGPDAVKGLAAAMKDEDAGIRRSALNGLLKAGGDGLPGLLIAVSDADAGIRRDAVSAIVALGTDEADEGMRKAISDPEPSIREKAAGYFIRKGGPGLPAVLAGLACDANPAVRSLGLRTLVGMRGEESSRSLAAYFVCGEVSTRETVVDVLSARGDPAALACLGSALKDNEARVRLKAAAALLAAGVKTPLFALAEDPDPGVKRVALTAMSETPSPAMLPAMKVLARDRDEGVRLLALDVLKGIPGEESGRIISEAISDGSASVRAAAREVALSRRDAGVVDGLYRLSVSGDALAGNRALFALGEIPGDAADEAILGVFRNGAPGPRTAALEMLSRRGSASFRKAETEAVQGTDLTLALSALRLAGSLPDKDREGLYQAAMSSKLPEVREAGMRGLAAPGGEAGLMALRKSLGDEDPAMRLFALGSLARLDDPELARRLPVLVIDPDPPTRTAALSAALRLGDGGGKADALVAAVDGPYPDVAGPALDALLPMGDSRALDAFMRAFKAGNRRAEMLRGMAAVKDGQAVEYLAKAFRLARDDRRLRLFAAKELAGRGPAALPALKEGLDDPDPDVRLTALRGVLAMDIPGPDRLSLLGRALADPYLEVRKLSLDTLAKTKGIAAARLMYGLLDDRELKDAALEMLLERPEPEITPDLASLAPGIKDPGLRARVVGAVFDRGYTASDALKFMDDPAQPVRAQVVHALAGRAGPDAAYGLLVLGGEPELGEDAARGLSGRNPEELRAGLSMMFGKGRAMVLTVGFAASHIKDAGLLAFIVDSVPASDTALLKAAVGPLLIGLAPYGLPAALKGLKSDDVKLKEEVAAAVAGLDSPETGAAMRDIYAGHPELRHKLFDAAVREGRVRELLPLAMKDPEETIRARAAELSLKEGYREGLYIAAADTSARIRKAAALGLKAEGGKDAPAVLGRLVLDPDDAVASAALSSLKDLGGETPSAVWAEIAGSSAARRPARLAAVKTLARREEPEYAPVLADALGDEDPEVRKVAREGLLKKGKDALPVLHGRISDDRLGVEALGLVREIGDKSSEGPIVSALPRMDARQRLLAVEALSRLGGPASLDALAGLYREGPDELRKAVLKTLGSLRLKGYEPALVEVLGDGLGGRDEEIRTYAARDAGALRVTSLMARLEAGPPEGASDALREAYRRSFETLRSEHGMLVYRLEEELRAARAAKYAGAYPVLLALYNDYDGEVRARAVDALKELPADKAGPLLIKALDDRADEVRRAAGEQVISRGGTGSDDVYGLFLIEDGDDARLRELARRRLSGMKQEELSGGITALLERGRATPGSIALAAGLVGDGDGLARMVEKIRPGDTALLRAALGPAMTRSAPGDLAAVVKGFKAEDHGLKEELGAVLAGLEAPGTGQALREVYAGHPELRAKLLTNSYENRRAMDLLPLGCKDKDEHVRALAVELAVRAGYGEGVMGAAGDSSARIRKMAAGGLMAVSGDEAVPLLTKLALDADSEVSDTAVSSLWAMGGRVPTGSWAALAEKGRGAVRLVALKAIADRREARYATVLAGALSDEDRQARDTAREGLLALGKDALYALNPLVGDERLQPVVLDLLGEIADPSSEGPILSAFPVMDMRRKVDAAGVLGKLGGPDSLGALYGLYRAGGQDVKAAVLKDVSDMRLAGDEKELVDMMNDALSNGSDNIRFRAAQAAGRLKVVSLAGLLEKGPGPGASSLLEEQYRKSLMLLKGRGSETGSTSP